MAPSETAPDLTLIMDDDSSQELAQKTFKQWQDRDQEKVKWVQEWREELDFLRGDHWRKWSYDSNRMVDIPNPNNSPRITVNIFAEIVRTVVSQLTRNRPSVEVSPRTSDSSDMDSARAGENLIMTMFDTLGFEELSEQVAYWMVATGNCITKTFWDGSLGDIITIPEMDESGQLVERRQPSGYVNTEVLGPFAVFPAKECRSLRDCRDIIQESLVEPETLEAMFGKKFDPDCQDDDHYSLARIRKEASKYQNTERMNLVRVLEKWWLEPADNFAWKHIVVIGKKVEAQDDWPLPRHPFTQFGLEFSPESFWRRTWMRDAISMNRVMNEFWSQTVMHMKLAVNRPMWAAKGQIREGRIRKEPGAINQVELVGNQFPKEMELSQLPQWFQQVPKDAQEMMNVVTGVSSVSQGNAPFAQASGRLVAFLSDLDSTKLGPASRALARGFSDISRQYLQLWQIFGPEEITLRSMGASGLPETLAFKKSDLSFADVRMEESSFMPMNRAVRNDMLERLLQLQIIDPPTFKKQMEFGAIKPQDLDPDYRDRQWARENIARIQAGQPPIIYDFMNEGIHYEVCVDWMKEGEFRNKTPPEIQQQFLQYVQYLTQKIAEAEQLKLQQAGQGGSPSPTPGAANPPAPPGPEGVPPEMAGSTNPPGQDLGEENQLATMGGMNG